MINKKGVLVLRDTLFMIIIVSVIFVFAGLFVSEMASNYENTNMTNEWAAAGTNELGNSTFWDTSETVGVVGKDLGTNRTGFWSFIEGGANLLEGMGKGLWMVLTAPNTIGNLLEVTLIDAGVGDVVTNVIVFFVKTILWVLVLFGIYTAFLRGSRV